jgi:hypothetical protein
MGRHDRADRERARHERQREAAGIDGLVVIVSLHALREQLKRCGYGRELTLGEVQHEVLEALVHGRLSKKLPLWLDSSSNHPEADDGHFFCWPADESRVWPVDLRQPRTIVVKTTLAKPPVNSGLQSELARWARAQEAG